MNTLAAIYIAGWVISWGFMLRAWAPEVQDTINHGGDPVAASLGAVLISFVICAVFWWGYVLACIFGQRNVARSPRRRSF